MPKSMHVQGDDGKQQPCGSLVVLMPRLLHVGMLNITLLQMVFKPKSVRTQCDGGKLKQHEFLWCKRQRSILSQGCNLAKGG